MSHDVMIIMTNEEVALAFYLYTFMPALLLVALIRVDAKLAGPYCLFVILAEMLSRGTHGGGSIQIS